jgi:hypothetical protein
VVRTYTVRYLAANGNELQRNEDVPYGSYVSYNGEIPTSGSPANGIYALFTGWDKSGYVTEDKDIRPLWQTYVYGENTAAGTPMKSTSLNKLLPVEVYAQLREENATDRVNRYGDYSEDDVLYLEMGETYDNYTDLTPTDYTEAIRQYTGSAQSYYDSKESLFDEDKDFVFAMDYKMLAAAGTMCSNFAQNFGFKLYCEGGKQKFLWGNAEPITLTDSSYREMLVIQHKQGDAGIKVYFSDKKNNKILEKRFDSNEFIKITVPLTFGAEKSGNNYTNNGQGQIYWARKFNGYLGDAECRALAGWTHEKIEMFPCLEYTGEIIRPKTYPISGSTMNETSHIAFMSTYALDMALPYGQNNYSASLWDTSNARTYLNERLVKGINTVWKQLLL